MKTKEFSFNLPEELIAQTPSERRGESRLLHINRAENSWTDLSMSDFPSLLKPDSLVIVNNSKVRKARVYGESETGGRVEFLFIYELQDHSWSAMVTKSRKQKVGKRFVFKDSYGTVRAAATIIGEVEDTKLVRFDEQIDETFFMACGHVPLPPYIKREDTFSDETRYQTVYAEHSGSVAAPTAGLHFTTPLLDALKINGCQICPVTLHVGMGTFLPVRSETLEDHHMHLEHYEVPLETAQAVTKAKKEGRDVVAIGTTSVRTLESAWNNHAQCLTAGQGSTRLFIMPGYQFQVVDRLLTNFHTPESTLLVLVSAFAGKDLVFRAYEHAVQEHYRFFSYGDATFFS